MDAVGLAAAFAVVESKCSCFETSTDIFYCTVRTSGSLSAIDEFLIICLLLILVCCGTILWLLYLRLMYGDDDDVSFGGFFIGPQLKISEGLPAQISYCTILSVTLYS